MFKKRSREPRESLSKLRATAHLKSLKRTGERESAGRGFAVEALGAMADERAMDALIKTMQDDPADWVRDKAAIMLARVDNDKVEHALEDSSGNCSGAHLALAWRHGGKYLAEISRLDFGIRGHLKAFQADVMAAWGDIKSLAMVIDDYPNGSPGLNFFHEEVISYLPEDFPETIKAGNLPDVDGYNLVRNWFVEVMPILLWNSVERKYYLDPYADMQPMRNLYISLRASKKKRTIPCDACGARLDHIPERCPHCGEEIYSRMDPHVRDRIVEVCTSSPKWIYYVIVISIVLFIGSIVAVVLLV